MINLKELFKSNMLDSIKSSLENFECSLNPDVEKFLKLNAIEFTKKNQSITYLVFENEAKDLLGYFTLTVKPVSIFVNQFSNTQIRRISRIGKIDEDNNTFVLSAFLIAQLGKNYCEGINSKISGEKLMGLALQKIRHVQNMIGGMVVFVEADNKKKLLDFYIKKNKFCIVNMMEKSDSTNGLIKMLKVL